MLKRCRLTKVKVLFLVLVYDFNFNLFEFSAAILEKGLLKGSVYHQPIVHVRSFFIVLAHIHWPSIPSGNIASMFIRCFALHFEIKMEILPIITGFYCKQSVKQ